MSPEGIAVLEQPPTPITQESPFSPKHQRFLRKIESYTQGFKDYTLEDISEYAKAFKDLSNAERIKKLPEVFALAGKAIELHTGKTLHPNQYIAAKLLTEGVSVEFLDKHLPKSEGVIAELESGEGKTFAIGVSAIFQAMTMESVHIITRDDYLTKSAAAQLGPVYDAFGLKVGVLGDKKEQYIYEPTFRGDDPEHFPSLISIDHDESKPYIARQHIYENCNIIYGTATAFIFDELIDNTSPSIDTNRRTRLATPNSSKRVAIEKASVIVDEVDEVAIDEATQPIILSNESPLTPFEKLQIKLADDIARTLLPPSYQTKKGNLFTNMKKNVVKGDYDVVITEGVPVLTFTEAGMDKILSFLKISSADLLKSDSLLYQRIRNAALAHAKLPRETNNKDPNAPIEYYQVYEEGRNYYITTRPGADELGVVLINPLTGHPLPDTLYQEGMHQALEQKHGITKLKGYSRTFDATSIQSHLRSYRHFSGTTGTAEDARDIFQKIYKIRVEHVPSHNKSELVFDVPDVSLEQGMAFLKILATVKNKKQQYPDGIPPYLIMVKSVEEVEELAKLFAEAGIPHRTLTAENVTQQADIIQHGGRTDAITIATFIAGRGVDTILQPEPDPSPDDPDYTEKKAKVDIRNATLMQEGLQVLAGTIPDTMREVLQAGHRGGRHGQPGYFRIISSIQSDIIERFGADEAWEMFVHSKDPWEVLEKIYKENEKNLSDELESVVHLDEVRIQSRQVLDKVRQEIMNKPNSWTWMKDHAPNILRKNLTTRLKEVDKIYHKALEIGQEKNQSLNKEHVFNKILDRGLRIPPYADVGLQLTTTDEINTYLKEQAEKHNTHFYSLFDMSDEERIRTIGNFVLGKLHTLPEYVIEESTQDIMYREFLRLWEEHLLEIEDALPSLYQRQRPLDEYAFAAKESLESRLGQFYDTLFARLIRVPVFRLPK